jgi:hypothetical protein
MDIRGTDKVFDQLTADLSVLGVDADEVEAARSSHLDCDWMRDRRKCADDALMANTFPAEVAHRDAL